MAKTPEKMRNTTWEYPSPYPSRSSPHNESEIIGLRALAETVLNLEYQLKVWRRHTFRRLDRIENRLHHCEDALSIASRGKSTNTSLGTIDARSIAPRNISSISPTHKVMGSGTCEPKANDFVSEPTENGDHGDTTIERSCTDNEEAHSTAEYVFADDSPTMANERNKNKKNEDDNESPGLTPDPKESEMTPHESVAEAEGRIPKPQRYFVCGMSAEASPPPAIQEPRKPDCIAQHTPRRHLSDGIDGPRPMSPPAVPQQLGNGLKRSDSDSPHMPRRPKLQRTLLYSPEVHDHATVCQSSQCDQPPAEANTFAHSSTIENVLGKSDKTKTMGQSTNSTPVAGPIYIVPQVLYSTDGDTEETDNLQEERSHSMSTCEEIKDDLIIDPPPPLSAWKRALQLVQADSQNEQLQKASNFTTSFSSGALLDVSSSTDVDWRE